jgi:hypothetical protein
VQLSIPRDKDFVPHDTLSKVRVRAASASGRCPVGSIMQSKPTILFDVNNIGHRQYYADFVKNNKWAPDAPRFYIEHPHISAPAMIVAKLLTYYISQDSTLNKAD